MKRRHYFLISLSSGVLLTAAMGCGDDGPAEDGGGSSSSSSGAGISSGSSGSSGGASSGGASSGGASSGGASSGGASSSSSGGLSSSSGALPPEPALVNPPKLARAGARVRLTGVNLGGAQPSGATVEAGSGSVDILSWSDNEIVFRAPQDARGMRTVTVSWGDTTLTTPVRFLARTPNTTFAFPNTGSGASGLAAIGVDGKIYKWGCSDENGIGLRWGCYRQVIDGNYRTISFGNFPLRLYGVGVGSNTVSLFHGYGSQISFYYPDGAGNRTVALSNGVKLGVNNSGVASSWTTDTELPIVTARAFDNANVHDVAAGWYFATALLHDGTVRSASFNNTDPKYECAQTAVPAGLTNVVAVAAGKTYSLALKDDGTVVQWGGSACEANASVAIAPPPANLGRVVAIAAGDAHSLALKDDGTVVGWGIEEEAAQNITGPAALTNVVAIAANYSNLERGSAVLQEDGTLSVFVNTASASKRYDDINDIPTKVKLPD